MVYSEQYRMVNNLVLSFDKKEKTFGKVSNKQLDQGLMFYSPEKYKTTTDEDFKFMAMWTIFTRSTNTIDTLKLMKTFDNDQLREIQAYKDELFYYQLTLKKDIDYLRTQMVNPMTIAKMLLDGSVSIIGYYWFMFKAKEADLDLGRIHKRTFERVELFLSFYPDIKSYIEKMPA